MFWHHHHGERGACHSAREHGWRHGPHGRHGRGGDGRGRVFDQGDLRLVLLQLISDKPSHGYELIKAVEERLGGAYSPSPGVVYPTLTLLEEMGYATVEAAEGGRKQYAVTAEGTAWLDANRAAVDAVFARMSEARGRGGVPPQVVRAMENLRLALKLKLGAGDLSDDQLRALAAAIDVAAVAVEGA